MAQTINTGSATINGSVAIDEATNLSTRPSSNLVTVQNTATNTLQTSTVPANKKWVIVGAWAICYGAGFAYVKVTRGGNVAYIAYHNNDDVTASGSFNNVPIILDAADTIGTVKELANGGAGFTYYEVDV